MRIAILFGVFSLVAHGVSGCADGSTATTRRSSPAVVAQPLDAGGLCGDQAFNLVDECCVVKVEPCEARPGAASCRCSLGHVVTERTSSCGGVDCTDILPNLPTGACVADVSSSTVEVVNGIDDNCDGVGIGDELCNGIDDDGDGLVDEDPGSCLQRFLFVPFCVDGFDAEIISTAVERWVNYFESKSLVAACGHQADDGKKFWTDVAAFDLIGCPASASLDTLLSAVKNAGVDLRNYDVVSFVTKENANACVAGLTSGTGLVYLETRGASTYPGEYVVFTHEFGHLIGLGEEYRVDPGKPNEVTATYGCDPTTCCHGPHPCPDFDGKLCLGNESRDAVGWSWASEGGSAVLKGPSGETGLPPTFGDSSRCIMSNASALGWDIADDIDTGEGSHRAWCPRCLEHYRLAGPKCIDTFAGVVRRLEANGHVDPDGKIFLEFTDAEEGRIGPSPALPQSGKTLIEMRDLNGALIASFTPDIQHGQPVTVTAQSTPFLVRVPIAPSVGLPVTFTSFRQGVQVSQVTGGGRPAVPVAGDVIAECTSPGGAVVTLDASASFDPDGDTVYFTWESPDVVLQGANTATPTGLFPLGVHDVVLHVVDGTNAGGMLVVRVTVEDTTPPDASIIVQPQCLWPPNHKLVPYALGSDIAVHLIDACDPTPTVNIAGVESDEPGVGDFAFGDHGFCVRSERDGGGTGRTYTITLEARDASQNKRAFSVPVHVAHDLGGSTCPALPNDRFVKDGDPRCQFP